jgi:hypothetical protein
MSKTIEAKLTGIIESAARAAKLELVIVEPIAGRNDGRLTGSWQVMDGLDTRLVVMADFGSLGAKFTLAGQALVEADRSVFKDHGVFPDHVFASDGRMVEYTAPYADGDRLRNLDSLLRALLAPYAEQPPEPVTVVPPSLGELPGLPGEWRTDAPAHPGESVASRQQAVSVLQGLQLNRHSIALVLRRAYLHGEGSFSYGEDARPGGVKYDREAGLYTVTTKYAGGSAAS